MTKLKAIIFDIDEVKKILGENNLSHIEVYNRNEWLKQRENQK